MLIALTESVLHMVVLIFGNGMLISLRLKKQFTETAAA
jgi:hypothetical protein